MLVAGTLAAAAGAQEPVLERERVLIILATTRDLSGRNLSGLDLSKLNFARTNLRRARLQKTNLEGADLWRADLSGADLSGARLAGAGLPGADLSSANLDGADLSRANLAGAGLRRAKLNGARLVGADLTRAELFGVELREAQAQQAVLKEAGLMLADLRGTDLTEANLEGAGLEGSQLVGANLTRASLRRARLARADFERANIAGADLVGADHTSARNIDRAVGVQQAKWLDTGPAPSEAGASGSAGPVTARIHLQSGQVVEVESWEERETTVVYTRGGVTYGVPRTEIAKVEDTQGRPLALRTPSGRSDDVFRCKTPRLGDAETVVQEYFRCTGVRPSFRTRTREGREMTVYTVPSRTARQSYDHYWVLNGQVVQVEVTGSQ
jgi:uncharacterized protein YjbI with pentapeptide repeats